LKDLDPDAIPATAERIAERLTDAVHEHRILPGMKLAEDEVGAAIGAGRTIVRQALRILAQDGLVTLERNRGAFVAEPSIREAREVFEARALVEPATARAAAARIDAAGAARLKAHVAAEHAALAEGRMGRALKLSGQFHVEIARIADQGIVEAIIRQLVSRSSLAIAIYWRRPSALCERHAHGALLDAFRAGDGAAAEELMAGHLLDLLSQLDLRDRETRPGSLREALRG
jgi:DNA-binding GntR family transcriptional regulator